MSMTTSVLRAPAASFDSGGTRRRTAVGLMAGGLTFVVGAIALVTTTIGASGPTPAAPAPTAAPVAGFTIAGTDGVAVHRMGYEPQGSSSWHRHSGIHAVAVLSGTLTIYGPDCVAQRFGAGESYVGGQGVHLTRNETTEQVELSVTYLFPAGVPLQDFVVPSAPPAGCEIR